MKKKTNAGYFCPECFVCEADIAQPLLSGSFDNEAVGEEFIVNYPEV